MKQFKQTLKRYSLVNFKIFLLLFVVSFGDGVYAQSEDDSLAPPTIEAPAPPILGNSTCSKPAPYSSTLCQSQYIYNCEPNKKYYFNDVLGSLYDPIGNNRYWKYTWYRSDDPNWNLQEQFKGGGQTLGGDCSGSLLGKTKSQWPAVDVFYLSRNTEEYYRDNSLYREWFVKEDHNRTPSLNVKLVLSACSDPDYLPISITGPTNLVCGQQSASYQLNLDNCGVAKITWTLPQGWSTTGALVGDFRLTNINVNTYNANSANLPKGGTVTAFIEFADGKSRTINYNVTAEAYDRLITLTGPTVLNCGQQQVNYTASFNTCGVTNVQWTLPQGWTAQSPTSGQWATTLAAISYPWSSTGNIPSGGDVIVTLSYSDGTTKTQKLTIAQKYAPLMVTFNKTNPYTLCNANINYLIATFNNGTAPYTYAWDGLWNLNTIGATSGTITNNKSTIGITPYQWSQNATETPSVRVTDANGCTVSQSITTKTTPGWFDGITNTLNTVANPYVWEQIPTKVDDNGEKSNFVSNKKGNLFYSGTYNYGNAGLATIRWNSTVNRWDNYFIYDGHYAPKLLIDEPYYGKASIYAIDETNNNIVVFENANYDVNGWSAPYPVSPLPDAQALLTVSDGYLYYIDNNKDINKIQLAAFNSGQKGFRTQIVSNVSLKSTEAVVVNNKLYIVEDKSGVVILSAYNTVGTITRTTVDPQPVKEGTNLVAYDAKGIAYASSQGNIRVIRDVTVANPIREIMPGIITNGNFSINPASEVIYSANIQDGAVWQAFYSPTDAQFFSKPVMNISAWNGTGYALFSSPNFFYISKNNGYIRQTYFLLNGCTPNIYRTGEANDVDHIEHESQTNLIASDNAFKLNVYPNPATDNTNIEFELAESASVTINLTDIIGNIVVSTVADYSQGKQTVNINTANLHQGLYFCEFIVNGTSKTVTKLVKE
ncbi:MAG: hypothetical protein RLZZ175_3010 [Bacteroidota bacterium]|jgi:hypothetical protein